MDTHIIRYDTTAYPFRDLVQAHFGGQPLDRLHEQKGLVALHQSKASDQSTPYHDRFYALYHQAPSFLALYQHFLRGVIRPLFAGPIVYQARPTFRISLPGNVAVGEWHKDSDYQHQVAGVNYWLPFTRAFGTNTIWIEATEDSGAFCPWELDYGEVLVFAGAILKHGNQVNDTGVCRVSMDFRVVPLAAHQDRDARSSHLGLPFKIGGYYDLLSLEAQ